MHDYKEQDISPSVAPSVPVSDKPSGDTHTAWAVYDQGRRLAPCERSVNALPAGIYSVDHNDAIGLHFFALPTTFDELIQVPGTESDDVVQAIEQFWTLGDRYRQFGFVWKRGVLLYGPPGSGKTSTMHLVAQRLIKERDGIVVFVDHPRRSMLGLRSLRIIEPDRPIIAIFEDIDTLIERWGEEDLLALLDGELQIDNVLYVATTNYPEKLDKRFINRPSRFDIIKKVGMPSEAHRAAYVQACLVRAGVDNSAEVAARWAKGTKEFSMAHLKELVISVYVLGYKFDSAIDRIKKMNTMHPSSSEFEQSVGFLDSK